MPVFIGGVMEFAARFYHLVFPIDSNVPTPTTHCWKCLTRTEDTDSHTFNESFCASPLLFTNLNAIPPSLLLRFLYIFDVTPSLPFTTAYIHRRISPTTALSSTSLNIVGETLVMALNWLIILCVSLHTLSQNAEDKRLGNTMVTNPWCTGGSSQQLITIPVLHVGVMTMLSTLKIVFD